jgi:hypothetical protein
LCLAPYIRPERATLSTQRCARGRVRLRPHREVSVTRALRVSPPGLSSSWLSPVSIHPCRWVKPTLEYRAPSGLLTLEYVSRVNPGLSWPFGPQRLSPLQRADTPIRRHVPPSVFRRLRRQNLPFRKRVQNYWRWLPEGSPP